LHYEERGEGAPVLLLHGLGQDHSVWSAQIAELCQRFQVLAPDLRGHGASVAPASSTFSFDEMGADINGLLAERGWSSAHVVGLSAGAFLALRMTVQQPPLVRSLITIAGAGHCDAHTRAVGDSWAEIYRDEGYDAYILRLLKDVYYPDWIEAHLDYADRLREEERNKDLRGVLQWGVAIRSFDVRAQLARIRTPTLIVQGIDDRVVDPSHARILRQSIPGSEVRLLAQTGHMVPLERPSETTQAIRDWVDKVETRGPAP
jgi:pimeloyl-ACP methyl ester carboxylesterase